MAVRAPDDQDPIPDFRFAVEIQGIVAGRFSECAGLAVERKVYSYEEGGLNAYVHQMPDRIASARITLKRGIASPSLWQWFTGEQEEGLYESKVARRDVTIILYGPDQKEAARWNMPQAIPVKWSGSQLSTGSDNMTHVTLELAQGDAAVGSTIQRAEATEPEGAAEQAPSRAEVDLPALARRLYALLQKELRIERERLGWSR